MLAVYPHIPQEAVMLSLIQQLTTEMEKIDPNEVRKGLKDKPAPHEHVIGKASDDLVKLYGVREEQYRLLRTHAVQGLRIFFDSSSAKGMEEKREVEKAQMFVDEGERMRRRSELLDQLFWTSVLEEFPETDHKDIGIRQEGQIVCWKEKSSRSSVQVIEIGVSGGGQASSWLRDLLRMRRQ